MGTLSKVLIMETQGNTVTYMKSSLILIAMIGLTILVALNIIDSSAMSACQEKHSYDVCFQQLNR